MRSLLRRKKNPSVKTFGFATTPVRGGKKVYRKPTRLP